MIFRSFHGLRFEALSPAKYVFRLEKGQDPLYLIFDGMCWTLQARTNTKYFSLREHATCWLRDQVILAELAHQSVFSYAHMEKADG